MKRSTLRGFDFVDACALAPGSPAGVVLAEDGTLVLVDDVLSENRVSVWRKKLHGKALRILRVGIFIVILTTKSIYFVKGIVTPLLAGRNEVDADRAIYKIPADSVDIFPYGDNTLGVLNVKDVQFFDIRSIDWAGNQESMFGVAKDQLGDNQGLAWENQAMTSEILSIS